MNKKSRKYKIMGVINVTPDSFSDGGDYNSLDQSVERGQHLIEAGVDILDIGGESTRPGAPEVGLKEELERVLPVIEALQTGWPMMPLSIDTYKAEVADEACKRGATIINDVWGLQREPEIAEVAASHKAHVAIGHWEKEMQAPVMEAMRTFFIQSLEIANRAGITEDKIILDPGIGFGKTLDDNLVILNRLDEIVSLGFPVLLGTSRKRFIGHILDNEPKERLIGTLATNLWGLMKGVQIIRVHDIKEHREAIKIIEAIEAESADA